METVNKVLVVECVDYCGGSCGECGADETCNPMGRCVPDPCIPDCAGKSCGEDGCGGDCPNTCVGTDTPYCVYEDSTCTFIPECNHNVPECVPECGEDQYCGTDCVCHNVIFV